MKKKQNADQKATTKQPRLRIRTGVKAGIAQQLLKEMFTPTPFGQFGQNPSDPNLP